MTKHRSIAAKTSLKILIAENRHQRQLRRRPLLASSGRRCRLWDSVFVVEIAPKHDPAAQQAEEIRRHECHMSLLRRTVFERRDITKGKNAG